LTSHSRMMGSVKSDQPGCPQVYYCHRNPENTACLLLRARIGSPAVSRWLTPCYAIGVYVAGGPRGFRYHRR